MVGWLFFDVGPIYSQASFPDELKGMARVTNAELSDVKVAGLGSFIDSEHVWRLSLPPSEPKIIVANHRLSAVTAGNVPGEFWQVFPLQWGPSHDARNMFYSTPGFPSQSRGPDGEYYFMMYDSQNQWLYVWHKFNF